MQDVSQRSGIDEHFQYLSLYIVVPDHLLQLLRMMVFVQDPKGELEIFPDKSFYPFGVFMEWGSFIPRISSGAIFISSLRDGKTFPILFSLSFGPCEIGDPDEARA
jgi:hypothetical protein